MKIINLALLTLLLFEYSFAQKGYLETKGIAIFKDGNSFVFKQGNVETTNNQFQIKGKGIPSGLFGTFWVASPFLSKVTTIVDTVDVANKLMTKNLSDFFSANKGKSVIVTLDDKSTIEGTIENVQFDNLGEYQKRNAWIQISMDGFAHSWVLVSLDKIKNFQFTQKPETTLNDTLKTLVETLSISFNGNQSSYPLSMMYLNKGLSWTPFYLLDIKDDSKATLSLRAEVVNKNEDIDNTTMSFVIGTPNFKYATKLADLFSLKPNENIYTIVEQQPFSRNQISSSTYYERVNSNGNSGTDNISPDNVEDLYYYTVKDFSMRRGERGHYPIFSHDIAIAHVFECNLQNNEDLVKNYNDYRFVPDTKNPVFHAVRMSNNTNTPWTTGSIMMVKNAMEQPKPVAQDLLSFTPIKGQVFVKITETPEIRVKQTEKEVARTAHFWNAYDLITIETSVQVTNYKSKVADMTLNRRIFGKLLESEIKWERQEFLAPNYNQINGIVSDVSWDFSVKNGEDKTFKYTYQVLAYNPH